MHYFVVDREWWLHAFISVLVLIRAVTAAALDHALRPSRQHNSDRIRHNAHDQDRQNDDDGAIRKRAAGYDHVPALEERDDVVDEPDDKERSGGGDQLSDQHADDQGDDGRRRASAARHATHP